MAKSAVREVIYGRQPVRECLRARRRHIHRLLLAEGVKDVGVVSEIVELTRQIRVPVERTTKGRLDRFSDAHQGVGLEVAGYPLVGVERILATARKNDEMPFLLALDHLQDPHNVGALLRTAEGVGVHGVLLPERRSAGITTAVVSASAGASEYVLVSQVTNLVRALEELKEAGVWVIGLDNVEDSSPYTEVAFDVPLVLVVGAEGEGLSSLVARTCDVRMHLPMRGRIQSLNASVAGAVALYAVLRGREHRQR